MKNLTINIASEFSAFPAGRFEIDGPFNGLKFQTEKLLDPVLEAERTNSKVIISLDGLQSCGSSFLEEAFGGLVRNNHIKKKNLLKVIEVQYSAAHLKRFCDAIFRYINEATPA